ncbi:MAG: hypothetical protein B0A82_15315 [Alkalinema sp. CACIAM 70d]|nr:MAG: hypothetical protein B0A82_15315 [Alkalinema sp. CACIAM 70d]
MLLSRTRFVDRLLTPSSMGGQTVFSLAELMEKEGYETAEGVVGRMLERLLGPVFLHRHQQLGLDVLTEKGRYPYFHGAQDTELRLRRLCKAIMSLPEYHLQ